eukprot:2643855-Rhodomonas_salina.3
MPRSAPASDRRQASSPPTPASAPPLPPCPPRLSAAATHPPPSRQHPVCPRPHSSTPIPPATFPNLSPILSSPSTNPVRTWICSYLSCSSASFASLADSARCSSWHACTPPHLQSGPSHAGETRPEPSGAKESPGRENVQEGTVRERNRERVRKTERKEQRNERGRKPREDQRKRERETSKRERNTEREREEEREREKERDLAELLGRSLAHHVRLLHLLVRQLPLLHLLPEHARAQYPVPSSTVS